MRSAGQAAGSDEPLAPGIRRTLNVFAAGLVVAILAASLAAYALVGDGEGLDPLRATVDAVASESRAVTDRFFDVAQSSGSIVERTTSHGEPTGDELRRTLENLVAAHGDIDGAFVGWPSGEFLYATRSLAIEPSGFRTKRISIDSQGQRNVTELQMTSEFQIVEEYALSEDAYDPRERPWYIQAETEEVGWTDTYSFASSQLPGITHFRAVRDSDNGALVAVVGIDMQLAEVENFLAERAPGRGGIAAVLSLGGSVISGDNPPTSALLESAAAYQERGSGELQSIEDPETGRVSVLDNLDSGDAWTLVVSATADDFGLSLIDQARRVRGVLPLLGLFLAALVAWTAIATGRRLTRLQRRASIDPATGLLRRPDFRGRVDGWLDLPNRPEHCGLAVVEVADRVIEAGPAGLEPNDDLLSCVRDIEAIGAQYDSALMSRSSERRIALIVRGKGAADLETHLRGLVAYNPNIQAAGCVVPERDDTAAVEVETMLWQAERALREARDVEAGVVQYDLGMERAAEDQRHRRHELEQAIEHGDFRVYFQPEVDIGSGRIIGAEALMRWQVSPGKVIAADMFIADLERFGLLDRLTPLIVAETAALARVVDDREFDFRVNFAGEQLRSETYELIRGASLDVPGRWCVEVTERAITRLTPERMAELTVFLDAGIGLALDDFGTGYSSLSEFEHLPVTGVKLDRSFVAGLAAGGKARGISELIHQIAVTYELDLVAEGIESSAQVDLLLDMGYRRGQGWFYGKAMDPASFAAIVHQGHNLGARA